MQQTMLGHAPIAAAGAVLAVDDIEDLPQWLDFAESGTSGTGRG